MMTISTTDNGSSWLLELSSRLLILGWFTLAGVTFGVLCGVIVVRSATRRETLKTRRLAA